MHCILAVGLSLAENHDGLNCVAGAACFQGWAESKEGNWSLR